MSTKNGGQQSHDFTQWDAEDLEFANGTTPMPIHRSFDGESINKSITNFASGRLAGAGSSNKGGLIGRDTDESDNASSKLAGQTGTALDDHLIGGSDSDVLDGLGGNDTLDGAANDDFLSGGDGKDSLIGGAGDDYLDGGVGADTLTGGTGNDVYYFVDASDVVVELSGEGTDTVLSNLTSVTLDTKALANVENLELHATSGAFGQGNSLNNSIKGGYSNDTLIGGSGDDTLDGGLGADRMIGGKGDDTYYIENYGDLAVEMAGEGTDTVIVGTNIGYADMNFLANIENMVFGGSHGFGNEFNNRITGNDLANTVGGRTGNDTLDGGKGNDQLSGDGGNDSLIGGEGSDTLDGGAGSDTMAGGTGNDLYFVDSLGDAIVEAEGEGIDQISTALTNFSLNTAARANVENLYINAGAGTGNALGNLIYSGGGADALYGLGGNDTLDGGGGSDTMAGGTGNDLYFVDSLGDAIVEAEGEGIDQISTALTNFSLNTAALANVENLYINAGFGMGNALDNLIQSGGGADTLDGYHGNDTLNGGGGADVMAGGQGNDTLNGGSGADAMYGGQGDDTYHIDSLDDRAFEQAGNGTDTVIVGSAIWSFDMTVSVNIENMDFAGWEGHGNELGNQITGNGQSNTISGRDGNDTLDGGADNDTVSGDGGNDSLVGGAGYDRLSGGVGNDTLAGGEGTGDLYGDAGNDSLIGGAGIDYLYGGVGADTMAGGASYDQYHVDNAGDEIIEEADGEIDEVYSSIENYVLGANVEWLSLGYGVLNGTGNSGDNHIAGNVGHNKLLGMAGNDSIDSNDGNDTLDGGAGEDWLIGDFGNDVLVGGADNDTLNGGIGADILYGGGGKDRFDLTPIDGEVDQILDFETGSLGDALRLADVLVGYSSGTSDANDFVKFLNDAGNTTVQVDVDGAANGANFVDVFNLQGVTLTSVTQAIANGNLMLD